MRLPLSLCTALVLTACARPPQDGRLETVLARSYSSEQSGDPQVTSALLKATETSSSTVKAMLCVRLAEVQSPFFGVEEKQQWYARAVDSDPAFIPAVAGLALSTVADNTNAQRWIQIWMRVDPTNALPYFALALTAELGSSNHVAALHAIANGNNCKRANFWPLFTELSQEQRGGWTEAMLRHAYTEYGMAHVALSGQCETMDRNLTAEAGHGGMPGQRAVAAALARMYDLLSCSEPFSELKVLRFTPLSIRSLERIISSEPTGSDGVSKDVIRLIDQRRNLLNKVRLADKVPDGELDNELRSTIETLLEDSPCKLVDRK